MSTAPWWRNATGYQIYLRSFADSNGDGIGDLRGVIDRLDHLVELGVDLLWLTPFYPSPMKDFGYDVADYVGVDERFGTLADLDELIAAAHARGLRLIADIVPNHTSDQHPWFRSARRGPDDPYRDHYIWADPAPGGGPPNNWISCFGGPAWTLDPASGQYYCHLFLPEQPDLNWANPAVLEAFDEILQFWLDRGLDGFRIDVAHALAKDPQRRSNPELVPWDPSADRWIQWGSFEHRHDVLQPAVLDIYRRWRAVAAAHDALLLGETYVLDADELGFMLPGDGLHAGFWFGLMHQPWSADEIRVALRDPLLAARADLGWAISSHDDPRPVTRFGGGTTGQARSLALSTLLAGLPGLMFLYQGEELGLPDGVLAPHEKVDPVGDSVDGGRDGCRTPIPWEATAPNLGFSTGVPWISMGGRSPSDTVEAQRADPSSPLHRYRALVAWRAGAPRGTAAEVEWLDPGSGGLIAYRRGGVVVAANLGAGGVRLTVPPGLRVGFSTGDARHAGDVVELGPDAAIALDRSDG